MISNACTVYDVLSHRQLSFQTKLTRPSQASNSGCLQPFFPLFTESGELKLLEGCLGLMKVNRNEYK